MIVTIDGLAGSGKSTAAHMLASINGYLFMSSGSAYRAITWYCLENHLEPEKLSQLELAHIESSDLGVGADGDIKINGKSTKQFWHTPEVTTHVTTIAKYPTIRKLINRFLRGIAEGNNLIVDGRDMGTVVFPEADVKFYIFADLEKRAHNAMSLSENADVDELMYQLGRRDAIDINRRLFPLKRHPDAFVIKTFEATLDNTISYMNSIIQIARFLEGQLWLTDNINYVGKPCYLPMAYLCDKPSFYNNSQVKNAKLLLFRTSINQQSHEWALFLDNRIPFIHGIGDSLDSLVNQKINIKFTPSTLNCSGIKVETDHLYFPNVNIPSNAVLNSSIEGMRKLLPYKVDVLAMRGEFIFLQVIDKHPLEILQDHDDRQSLVNHMQRTIEFATSNFSSPIYRFTDFNYENLSSLKSFDDYEKIDLNWIIGNRGTHRLLNMHTSIFELEIEITSAAYRQNSDFSVLLPFVRSIEEAGKALTRIKEKFNGKIGCMIETPLMLGSANRIMTLFDFFVIGASDLMQLCQGTAREQDEFSHHTYEFVSSCVDSFVMSMKSQKTIFVTDRKIYNMLHHHENIFFLTKIG